MMSSEPNRQNKPNGPGAASLQLAFNLVPFVGCFFLFWVFFFTLLFFTWLYHQSTLGERPRQKGLRVPRSTSLMNESATWSSLKDSMIFWEIWLVSIKTRQNRFISDALSLTVFKCKKKQTKRLSFYILSILLGIGLIVISFGKPMKMHGFVFWILTFKFTGVNKNQTEPIHFRHLTVDCL